MKASACRTSRSAIAVFFWKIGSCDKKKIQVVSGLFFSLMRAVLNFEIKYRCFLRENWVFGEIGS